MRRTRHKASPLGSLQALLQTSHDHGSDGPAACGAHQSSDSGPYDDRHDAGQLQSARAICAPVPHLQDTVAA
ncbi:ORF107L [Infectious spleen and kidney necrosis virus]|uniref:ORF107L n=2 Tax=Infectious spleen and kidney necrosis virus TaxID=180170 RepID=Q8QUK3_ISKNN|nr:ORF107L [Infectious spleen and kidney necrosis virus]AAL98831.1 ORF107L [Infectious spleen and kidney necrosis virus]AMM04538.1 ORF115L [Infectious spleen and kidney necrosis virus]